MTANRHDSSDRSLEGEQGWSTSRLISSKGSCLAARTWGACAFRGVHYSGSLPLFSISQHQCALPFPLLNGGVLVPPATRIKVLNLCICAWQAIAAVAPPVPAQTSALTLAPPPEGKVRIPLTRPPPPPLAKAGSTTNDATLPADAGVEVSTSLQDAMEVEAIGRDGRDGPCAPCVVERAPPVAGDGEVNDGSASGAMRKGCGSSVVDAFADPLKALVRCLCGVVIGRWRQASSNGRAPKKAWVLHAKEGVLALIRALQVSDLTRRKTRRGMKDWGKRVARLESPSKRPLVNCCQDLQASGCFNWFFKLKKTHHL